MTSTPTPTPTSTSSEMVERVARAICVSDCTPYTPNDDYWKRYTPHALAVIKAMREPTRPMLTRGVVTLVDLELDGPDGGEVSDARAIFTAMIDAALSETPEAGER